MDEPIVTWLPDVTEMPLSELLTTDDPTIRAALDELIEQVRRREPGKGCGC
jgi:hypothetical protein